VGRIGSQFCELLKFEGISFSFFSFFGGDDYMSSVAPSTLFSIARTQFNSIATG
jgi:hypothetical protein